MAKTCDAEGCDKTAEWVCDCGALLCNEHNDQTDMAGYHPFRVRVRTKQERLLERLIELTDSQIPEGVEEAETQTVNPPGIVWDAGGRPSPPTLQTKLRGPWISIALTNDGPSNVTLTVNDSGYQDTIKTGETRTVDMKAKGKIRRVELDVTGTATVRIAAVR